MIVYCDHCVGRTPAVATRILRGKPWLRASGGNAWFLRCDKCFDLIQHLEIYEEYSLEEYIACTVMES
jgi:hypothetical protein